MLHVACSGTLRKVKDVCCGVFVKVLKTKRLRHASTLTKVSVNGQMKDRRKILLTAFKITLFLFRRCEDVHATRVEVPNWGHDSKILTPHVCDYTNARVGN